jgi:hypothetical protein
MSFRTIFVWQPFLQGERFRSALGKTIGERGKIIDPDLR